MPNATQEEPAAEAVADPCHRGLLQTDDGLVGDVTVAREVVVRVKRRHALEKSVGLVLHVGDQVGPEMTVCIIEAMKVFNEIPAEVSGKVVEMLVKNGDAVDVGRKLFKVSTS